MVRTIMKDPLFLARKSREATEADAGIAQDLRDTLLAHRDECVGMAANMIGENVRIIAVMHDNGMAQIMYNPVIVAKSEPYEATEGCLSLSGERKTRRYNKITVKWSAMGRMPMTTEFKGFVAEIIQHEVDHCNGVLI